jgi:putative heme transporter
VPETAGTGTEPADLGPPEDGGPVSATGRVGRSTFRRAWPYIRFILGLAGAALVLWVLSSHTDELYGASSVFDHLRWAWLVPAVLVEGASYFSLAKVQRRLLATGGVDAPMATLSLLTLATQAIINSLPGGSAVATVYGFRWFRRLGADDSLAVWALIATVVVGVISLALVAAAGLALAADDGASLDLVPVTIGVLLVTIAVGALLLYQPPPRAGAPWVLRVSRRVTARPLGAAEARVAGFLTHVAAYRPSKRVVGSVLGWGIGNWVFDCACFAFSFLAIGAGIPWKGLLLSYGAGQLAANLPITPGGLGVVEGSITIALVAFGGNRVSTVEAVLMYRILSFWSELVVGWAAAGWLAWGVRRGRWRRQVRTERSVAGPMVEQGAGADGRVEGAWG